MDKIILLREYIKKTIHKILKEQEEKAHNAEKALFLIHRFPKLKELFVELMSPAYGRFIASIEIIAPKPTTFLVELINGQQFEIAYLGLNKFRLKILGKKYYPSDLKELERASQAIANMLTLSKVDPNEEASKQKEYDAGLAADMSGGGGTFGGGSFPGGSPEQLGGELPTGEPEIPVSTEPLTADSEIPENPDEEKPEQ